MILILILLLIFAFFGIGFATPAFSQEAVVLDVPGVAETVASPGDGATGVAVWLHPNDLSQSVILGGDDNDGLGVYALDGSLLQFWDEDGAIGNVDLRYGFPFGSQTITLIAGANTDETRIILFTIDPETRTLERLGEIETDIAVNGVCMTRSTLTRRFYVVTNNENGRVQQYRIEEDDGEFNTTLAREFYVGGETEGCTADDALGRLYISEEDSTLWRYGNEPEDGQTRRLIDIVQTDGVGGRIVEQVEGVTLYATGERGAGYLIAANEQGDSFLVYERGGDNAFVGEFTIGAGDNTDALTEPNGVAVVNLPLGDLFPEGVFIASDDVNSQPNADSNFKLISWAEVAAGLGLVTDTVFDPRAVAPETIVNVRDAATVTAVAETIPVPSQTDAADDPAIWVNPADPALSAIVGTDKTNGLVVYDLEGNTLDVDNIGRVNNVDLRPGFMLGEREIVLVAATNRSENSLVLYALDSETRQLEDIAARPFVSGVEEVYGLCMYVSPSDGAYYAFVNSADTGEVEQWRLTADGDRVDAEVVRQFAFGTQTEGCVADDTKAVVYIGEEAAGFYRYAAEPDAPAESADRVQVDTTGDGGNLTADTEGITLYTADEGSGYLIVSSQGSSTFVVYERTFAEGEANTYVGTFRVVENEIVDAVSGTDGLDVTAAALPGYPAGLLVVQDDLNINPDESQNFKLISWAEIAAALGLP